MSPMIAVITFWHAKKIKEKKKNNPYFVSTPYNEEYER